MANEITVLEGDGEKSYTLLMIFPIGTPTQVAGQNVVPTPSVSLPDTALSILTTAEKSSLDAGTSMFRLVNFTPDPALTNAQLATRVRAMYTQQTVELTRWYQQTYRWAGTRINSA